MPVHNSDVADIFNKVADLLDIKSGNPFRIRAYRNAARAVNALSRNVSEMVAKREDLSSLQGIGKDLAQKITEIVQTGKLPLLNELEKEVPKELSTMMKIQGLGPKKIKKISQEMNIQSIDELREAAKEGKNP